MTSTGWQQTGGGLPGGQGPTATPRWRIYMKLLVVLILLASLGWVLLLATRYCQTRQPLTELPGVLEQATGLANPPRYLQSIDGVQRPLGVAISPDGKIYVTETAGERMIHIFDTGGKEISSFAPPHAEGPARVPVYVAVSPTGEVYVSDRDSATIHVFSADGSFQGRVDSPLEGGGVWHPLGLAFDGAGNLYVTEVTPEKHRVLVLDPEGKLKLEFGTQGSEDGEFWFPNAVAVDEEGRMYVSDSNNGRVQVFDSSGGFLYKIGRGLARGDLSLPRGIAIDDSHLFVVDTSRQSVQVYDISETPRLLHSFGGDQRGVDAFNYPNGLALDDSGTVYVTDRENNRIAIWRY